MRIDNIYLLLILEAHVSNPYLIFKDGVTHLGQARYLFISRPFFLKILRYLGHIDYRVYRGRIYTLQLTQESQPKALQWRLNGRHGLSNHQPYDCLLNRLFRHRSIKTPKLRVTGLCEGNSPLTGELPAQTAINAENVSIWWRYHDNILFFISNHHTQYIKITWFKITWFNHV